MFESTFSSLLFTMLKVICWAVNRLTQLFEVFSGLTKVSYRGEDTFLFNIFLNNSAVNNIYWGMALIGIALCFGFAIFSAARKMFDLNNKNPMSTGQIVTELAKSFFLIISMNLILTMSITAADVLLRQINYMFNNAEGLDRPRVMEYTDEQYSAMGRALSTIANYGMNPSYNSRYNVNDCFNTIRPDLVYLEEQGVFDCNYQTTGVNSWQSALQEVANAADLRYELKSDVYYEKVVDAMEHVLEIMKNDASFRPLERYEQYRTSNVNDIPLDRVVFLVGTLDAANNNYFNRAPSFDDALRYPYYTGEKSLYDTDEVSSIDVISGDFNLNYSRFDYLVSFVLGIAILYNTFVILLNLAARMFNILFLYIIAPPVLASRPLDGGGKTRQWTTAFIVQLLGVFGNIIAMRLLLMFIPVIFDPTLVLIQGNSTLNYFGKAVILIAAYSVAKKAASLLSGILTDTAGMQSTQAGEMSSTAQRSIMTARMAARSAGSSLAGAAGLAAAPMVNTLKRPIEQYKKLGSGQSSSDLMQQARNRLALSAGNTASGGSPGGSGVPGGSGNQTQQNNLPDKGGLKGGMSEIGQNASGGSQLPSSGQGVSASQSLPNRPRSTSHSSLKSPSLDGGGSSSVRQQSDMRGMGGNVSSESQSSGVSQSNDRDIQEKGGQGSSQTDVRSQKGEYVSDMSSGSGSQKASIQSGSGPQQGSVQGGPGVPGSAEDKAAELKNTEPKKEQSLNQRQEQPRRRNSVPQKDISDFMRKSYRVYDNELNKNKDKE